MAAQKINCRVIQKVDLTPSVFQLEVQPEQRFSFKGGQFISVVIPGAGKNGRNLRRAYSIASWPEKDGIELCIKRVEGGPGTQYLYSLKPGDSFEAYAPYGDFVYKTPPEKKVMFIATGTGLAPFRSMVFSKDYKSAPPQSAMAVFGITTDEEVLYQKEMSAVTDWVCCLSRNENPNWEGVQGRVTQYLNQLPEQHSWDNTEYYLCGNGAMITEVKQLLVSKGVDKKSIFQEIYFKPKDNQNG